MSITLRTIELKHEKELRIPSVPITSPGRPSSVKRGDWVSWVWEGTYFTGRVLGVFDSPDNDGEEWLCVSMLMLGGSCCERWVDPKDVVNTAWHKENEFKLLDFEGKSDDDLRKGSWA